MSALKHARPDVSAAKQWLSEDVRRRQCVGDLHAVSALIDELASGIFDPTASRAEACLLVQLLAPLLCTDNKPFFLVDASCVKQDSAQTAGATRNGALK
jgi:hypothetical protein